MARQIGIYLPPSKPINPNVQNLSPLLVLLVTGVMVARLLCEVGKHGGQRLPADRVRLVLLAHIPAHGRELSNRLTKWNQTSIIRYVKAYLQKSTIGVSLVSGKSKSDNILDENQKNTFWERGPGSSPQ